MATTLHTCLLATPEAAEEVQAADLLWCTCSILPLILCMLIQGDSFDCATKFSVAVRSGMRDPSHNPTSGPQGSSG